MTDIMHLLESFRSTLPKTENREMWVNETLLEFRRLQLLRGKGINLRPIDGSLLSCFLAISSAEGGHNVNTRDNFESYKEVFGHAPSYCWTEQICKFGTESGATAPMPGVAWMNKECK